MNQYQEIRRTLVEDFGFTDLDAYRRWIERDRPKLMLNAKLIERLSPDQVDCRDFWRACDDLFGPDPVSNLAVNPTVGRLPYAVESRRDANRMNLRFAKSFGITHSRRERAAATEPSWRFAMRHFQAGLP